MLPGSQGELGDSVGASQYKCNPQLGGSIASSLCTQDLALFREAWQREESRCMGPSCHQLSWLAPLQFLTSAVVTVFLRGCREQLGRNRNKMPCLQRCEGTKNTDVLKRKEFLRRSLALPGVLALEDARYGHAPALAIVNGTCSRDRPFPHCTPSYNHVIMTSRNAVSFLP